MQPARLFVTDYVGWSELAVGLEGSDFVNVAFQDGDLYATAQGELFCLDPATGTIRWRNPLKGFGRGLVTIAASGSQQTVVMGEKRQRDEAAAAAASSAAIIG